MSITAAETLLIISEIQLQGVLNLKAKNKSQDSLGVIITANQKKAESKHRNKAKKNLKSSSLI